MSELLKYLKSEEGEKSLKEFFENKKKEEEIRISQIERLHNKQGFVELINKSIEKYNSKNYKNRWYKRGIEPPEELFWFIFDYAKKHGRECTQEEIEKHANMFTSDMFFLEGFYIQQMDGQGSVIKITKL